MRLFGLIGYPLAQSFSKKFFSAKFEREGREDCKYELFEIRSIDELSELMRSNPDLEGLNVTIPYKQLVLPFLHSMEGLPVGLAACNCIRIKDGKLSGYNTDVTGFEKSLVPQLKPHHTKALVLGNGGATAAVVYVLDKLGIDHTIVSRRKGIGSTITYDQMTEQVMHEHTLIINTTPVGSFPAVDQCPNIPYQFITSNHYLFDVVYNPDKSLFLQKGEERGASVKNGYEWLVVQAEESWVIWNLVD
ncbi:MAG: shikimate dehydrogenase [Chitinophagaceae bacterium]|nr:shikimate dehydrogenase [Chitinophagaceae bacterium]